MVSGIYKITNKITGEIYIGATENLKKRLWAHKNQHSNLKNFINKYGVENFTFEIIEECPPDDLRDKERYYINLFDSRNNGMIITAGGERGSVNTTGYYHVHKDKHDKYVQGYLWRYNYEDNQGNRLHIRRSDLNKLKEEVINRGLKWEVVDKVNAKKSDIENEKAMYLHKHHVKNNTGLYRVSKSKSDSTLTGFIYVYNYLINGKNKTLSSVRLDKLEKMVKDKGLKWEIIDKNKAKKTYEEYRLNDDKHKVYNETGFYHVWKIKDKSTKQGFKWVYWYYTNEGVKKTISRMDLIKLEAEIKKRGLFWKIIDEEKALNTLKQNKEKFIDAKNTSNNSSGFYHVFKEKSSKYSQGYIWIYHFTDDDGKKKKIRRVNLHDLKEEVLSRGMEWRIVNEELARLNL